MTLMGFTAQSATAAPFRAFSADSPWNIPADQKGAITSSNPYASEFTSYSSTLDLEGIPPDKISYAKPTFFAGPGDPEAPVTVTRPEWAPNGDVKWDGRPVPVPAGATPASGSDGHLTIISADRRTAWEFWGCTSASPAGIVTQVIAQWDLTGRGYSTRHSNSARGSGTPLISTTLRADEALGGINHATGLSVPHASSDFVGPVASKSDGERDGSAVKYGMLFVLRDDYPTPAKAGIGARNLIRALKTYGAYIVDQGASMEIDADSTHADQWAQSGLSKKSLPLLPSDWRLVNVGAAATPKRSSCNRSAGGCKQVTVKAASRVIRRGGRVRLAGRIASSSPKHGSKALVQLRRRHGWHTVHATSIKHGRYATKVRVRTRSHRKIRLRVKVRGLRSSKQLVLRVRR